MKDFNPKSGGSTEKQKKGSGATVEKRTKGLGGKDKQKKGSGRKSGVTGTPTSSCQTRNQKQAMDAPVAASTRRGNSGGGLLTPGKRNPPPESLGSSKSKSKPSLLKRKQNSGSKIGSSGGKKAKVNAGGTSPKTAVGGGGLMTKAAAARVSQKYQNKSPTRTMTQLKITGSGGKLVSREALMLDQDILLTEEIYENGPPVGQEDHYFHYTVTGFDTTSKKITLTYAKKHIHKSGHDWKSLPDEDEDVMENVSFDHVRKGVQRYKEALQRVIQHKARDMAVTKAALSVEVEEAVELKASDIDMSDLNAAALGDKIKGWHSMDVIEVSYHICIEWLSCTIFVIYLMIYFSS